MAGSVIIICDDQLARVKDGRIISLTSQREQQYRQALRELETKYEWKTSGAGAQFMKQTNPYKGATEYSRCRLNALAGLDGKLLYSISTPESGYLYLKDCEDDAAPEGHRYGERGLDITDLSACGGKIAFSAHDARGEYHIALMEEGRAGYRWVTSGDTYDAAPAFSRDGKSIFFESSGLARGDEGYVTAKAPAEIMKLDLAAGTLEEICADPEHDYIRPRMAPDGGLYMIKKPYKTPEIPRISVADRIRNIGNFFRGLGNIVRALGNTDSIDRKLDKYAGAGTAVRTRILNGVAVSVAEKPDEKDERGWAPDDWVLVRRSDDGGFTEILKGVADYDFDGGAIIYTDGRRVFRYENGRREKLCKGAFIPRIAVIK